MPVRVVRGTRGGTVSVADTGDAPTSMRSDLDHVVAADHLRFVQFDGADVDVCGWPKLPVKDQPDWMSNYSDHGLLYFEVERVA